MLKEQYDIGGMHCAACSSAVERVTRKLPGVKESNVNLIMNRMTIRYDETKTTPEMIINKIEKAGFTAKKHIGDTPSEFESPQKSGDLKRLIAMLCLAGIDFVLSMSTMFGLAIPLKILALLEFFVSFPVLILGKRFFTSGFKSLFHLNPNMDTLVALSASASFIYSLVVSIGLWAGMIQTQPLYYESAAMVVALVSLGKFLESRSSDKTKDAVKKLRALAPDTAILAENGKTREIKVSDIQIGDILLIQTGMSAPVDGSVTQGEGHVNESMLTGESTPVKKHTGDPIIGGSIVIDGAIYMRTEKIGSDTMFAKIVKYVEDAQGQKAPIARAVDKVAAIFVPAVLSIALIAAMIWLLCGQTIPFALNIFTSVLVIACPCAMGLATPTAIIVGTGMGASHGILIRSAAALELTHHIQTVVFDKTGTLTEGTPKVTDLLTDHRDLLLSTAFAVERNSSHPIAKAICQYAKDNPISPIDIHDYQSIDGKGLTALNDADETILIGSTQYMQEHAIDISTYQNDIERLQNEAKTVVCIAQNQKILGILGIADDIRSDARQAIQKLKALGIQTVMLTGDQDKVAKSIATKAGLDDYKAGILPTQKAEAIQQLQQNDTKVMMVGDGINDAPALTRADIGCAIGSGSDIAIDSAQIILIKNRLMDVVQAIELSRKTMKKIKQNLFWAFCYNTLGIPIAAGVFYPAFGILLVPMVCAIAMCLSSIFVVTNALSLKKALQPINQ